MIDRLSVSRIQNHIGKRFLFLNIYDAIIRNCM